MRRLFLPLLLCLPLALPAQWTTGVRAGSSVTRGHARNIEEPDRPELRPDHPGSIEGFVGHRGADWQFRVAVRHRSADVTVSGGPIAVVTLNALEAWGAGGEVGHRLAGASGHPRLDATLGVSVDRWDLLGADQPRWHPELRGGLELEVPIVGRWLGLVRGEVAVTRSLFETEDLPAGYQRRTGWSSGLSIGVARVW